MAEQQAILDDLDWIEVVEIPRSEHLNQLLDKVDRGEAEAIMLALELKADFLIIDERKGRAIAKTYDIPIIGLLGILVLAKKEGLLPNVRLYLEKLKNEIGFRISENLYRLILKEAGESDQV